MKLASTSLAVIFLFLSSPANARNFKIGAVKKSLQTDFVCASDLPGTKESVVLVDRGSDSAWINIDGKDIMLKEANVQTIKSDKRVIYIYSNRNILLIVNSKHLRTIEGALDTDEFLSTVTFKIGNISKTIKTKGYCS
jgi:hypothetical protein